MTDLPALACPGCNNRHCTSFYSVNNVPINSCIMLDSWEQALTFPTGNIELVFCYHCGFIFNRLFDHRLIEYSDRYEDQQVWSETFNTFQAALVDKLIDTCNIRNKTVLEIGCGKGDFLKLICDRGNNHGIGIDPAINTGRWTESEREVIALHPEFYSDNHGSLKPDFICCRHTLEHIPDTAGFIQLIRRSLTDNTGVKLFFEVPDTTRILEDLCFQDIYYEHCSYFLDYSLFALFKQHGFSVDQLYRDFNDQYLLIIAGLNASSTVQDITGPNQVEQLIKRFGQLINTRINDWRDRITTYQSQQKQIVIWGSGSKCVAFLSTLGINHEHIEIVDVNPYRQGKYPPGISRPVLSPADLTIDSVDIIIVMNKNYIDEIRKTVGPASTHIEFVALD